MLEGRSYPGSNNPLSEDGFEIEKRSDFTAIKRFDINLLAREGQTKGVRR